MAKKENTTKVEFEREYTVPLRAGWLKVPEYKRANKAVKTLKEFLARHMKVYDRDLRKIKVDVDLNNELRFRGMKKPPAKIRVKAKKFDDDTVRAELVDLPKHIEFRNKRVAKVDSKKAPEIKQTEEIKKDVEKAVEETKAKVEKKETKSESKKKEDKKETTEKAKK